MKCPHCTTEDLLISERKNIEIDFCPKCRGVWLDKGELDKMIEISATHQPDTGERDRRRHEEYDDDDDDNRYRGKRKRESFLGEIFDF